MDEQESTTITLEDFLRPDIRTGEIVTAEPVPKSDKLLKLQVHLGELGTRTIVAGIAKHYANPVGQLCLVVVNLMPRKMFGIESHGMLLAGESEGGGVFLASCPGAARGARVG